MSTELGVAAVVPLLTAAHRRPSATGRGRAGALASGWRARRPSRADARWSRRSPRRWRCRPGWPRATRPGCSSASGSANRRRWPTACPPPGPPRHAWSWGPRAVSPRRRWPGSRRGRLVAGLGPRVLQHRDRGPGGGRPAAGALGRPGRGSAPGRGMTPAYEYFETDADIGVIGRGLTAAEAFAQTALGIFALIVEPDEVEEREQREVRAHGDSLEGLLVAWINECLYVHDVEGFVARRIEIAVFDDTAQGRRRAPAAPFASFTGRRSIRPRHRLGTRASRRPRCERGRRDAGPPRAVCASRRGSCWTSSVSKMRQGGRTPACPPYHETSAASTRTDGSNLGVD